MSKEAFFDPIFGNFCGHALSVSKNIWQNDVIVSVNIISEYMSDMPESQGWKVEYHCRKCGKRCEVVLPKTGHPPSFCDECGKTAASDRVRRWRERHPEAARDAAKKQNAKRRKPGLTQTGEVNDLPLAPVQSKRFILSGNPATPYQKLILGWAQTSKEDVFVEDNLVDARIEMMIEVMKLAPEVGSEKTLLVFNNLTREEFTKKLNNSGIKVQTIYEAGQKALESYLSNPLPNINQRKYKVVAEKIIMDDIEHRLDDNDLRPAGGYSVWCNTLAQLCDLARLTLTDPGDHQALVALGQHYKIMRDLPDWAVDGIATILDQDQAREKNSGYDLIDLIWLPIIWQLPLQQYTFIAVDEVQNMNRLEREFILRLRALGGRIMWFADSESRRIV